MTKGHRGDSRSGHGRSHEFKFEYIKGDSWADVIRILKIGSNYMFHQNKISFHRIKIFPYQNYSSIKNVCLF